MLLFCAVPESFRQPGLRWITSVFLCCSEKMKCGCKRLWLRIAPTVTQKPEGWNSTILTYRQPLGLELTRSDRASGRRGSTGNGCKRELCWLPSQHSHWRCPDGASEMSLRYLEPSCPTALHNSQHPDLLHWELVSQALQLLFPELLSQIHSNPSPPPSFFMNTSKHVQLSTPKPPTSCTPEPLIASVPHLRSPLSQSPSYLPLYPPQCLFTLYGSIYTPRDSPLPTSWPQALWGLSCSADMTIDFVASAVPHLSSNFLPAFTAKF